MTFPPYSMGHKKGLFRLDIHFFTYLGKTCTDNLSRKKKNLTDRVEIVNSMSSIKFWYGEEWRRKVGGTLWFFKHKMSQQQQDLK